MKKNLLLAIFFAFLFSSCAIHSGVTTNSTEVHLSSNNFKVLTSVRGESKTTYVFGIGGLSKRGLIAKARAAMLSKSDIVGGPKAIINETIEIKHSFFPIVRTYEVIVSGHIVEFTK